MMSRLLLVLLICSLFPVQVSPDNLDPITDIVFMDLDEGVNLKRKGIEYKEFSHLPFIQVKLPRGMLPNKILAKNQMAQKTSYYTNEQINLPYQNELIDSDFSVVIMDTGIDEDHILLEQSDIVFKDFVFDNSDPSDVNGHGTQVASIIAGYDQSRGYKSIYLDGNFSLGIHELFTFSINITSDFTLDLNTVNIPDIYLMGDQRINGVNINSTFRFPSLDPGSYQLMYDALSVEDFTAEIRYLSKTHFSGVAPGANLIAIKVLDNNGKGDISTVLNAIDWIITNRDVYNISVVNMSFSFDEVIDVVDQSVNILRNFGIVPVVAAGNNGWDGIFSPASAIHAITVGAVDNNNDISSYSSIEPSLNRTKSNIYAPGGEINTASDNLFTAHSNDIDHRNGFTHSVGTSFAAPHVTGTLLLFIEEYIKFNDWIWYFETVDTLKKLLYISSREVTKHLINWGTQWGLLDLTAAIKTLNGSVPFNTPFELEKDQSYVYLVPQSIDPEFPIYIHTTDAKMYLYNLTLADPLVLQWSGTLLLDDRHEGLMMVITTGVDDVISITNRAFPKISWAHGDLYIPTTDYVLDFRATSSAAEIFINDTSVGIFYNRQNITLQEGMNNITAVETSIGGQTNSDSVIIHVDLKDPTLNITDIIRPKDGEFVYRVSTYDNNLVDKVEMYTDNRLYNNFAIGDDTLEFFPYNHSPGEHNISIIITDIAGRTAVYNETIILNHTDYLIPLSDQFVLTDKNLNLIWEVGSDVPNFYDIKIENDYGQSNISESWSGSNIAYNLQVERGINKITLTTHSFIKTIETVTLIIAFDVFNPELEFPDGVPEILDMTGNQVLRIILSDYELEKVLIFFADELLVNDTSIDGKFMEYSINIFSDFTIKSDLLIIKAWDSEGNHLLRKIDLLWQDLTAPVIQPLQQIYIFDVGTNFTLEFWWVERFDEHIEIWLGDYKVFNNNSIGWTSISFDYLDPGLYEIELKVFDIGGNMASIVVDVEVKGYEFSVITQSSPISIVFVLGLFWRRKR